MSMVIVRRRLTRRPSGGDKTGDVSLETTGHPGWPVSFCSLLLVASPWQLGVNRMVAACAPCRRKPGGWSRRAAGRRTQALLGARRECQRNDRCCHEPVPIHSRFPFCRCTCELSASHATCQKVSPFNQLLGRGVGAGAVARAGQSPVRAENFFLFNRLVVAARRLDRARAHAPRAVASRAVRNRPFRRLRRRCGRSICGRDRAARLLRA